jgi:hypothetical protein
MTPACPRRWRSWRRCATGRAQARARSLGDLGSRLAADGDQAIKMGGARRQGVNLRVPVPLSRTHAAPAGRPVKASLITHRRFQSGLGCLISVHPSGLRPRAPEVHPKADQRCPPRARANHGPDWGQTRLGPDQTGARPDWGQTRLGPDQTGAGRGQARAPDSAPDSGTRLGDQTRGPGSGARLGDQARGPDAGKAYLCGRTSH